MPTISSRSLKELNKLKATGKLEVEGLTIKIGSDSLSVAVVDTVIEKYKSNQIDTSNAVIGDFINEIFQRSQSDVKEPSNVIEIMSTDLRSQKKWAIESIKIKNFRGLTEYNGEEFKFSFNSKPYFILGTNGSGKTGILSAIIWCLTGFCLKERSEPVLGASGIELFAKNNVTKAITAWPYVVTVPHNRKPHDIFAIEPFCSVEVTLKDETGEVITAKRSLSKGTIIFKLLNSSSESINLESVGISDLDLELSLLMPSRVMTIQFQPGSKITDNLISIAGLDSILNIGGQVRNYSKAVTKYRNLKDKEKTNLIDSAKKSLDGVKTDEFNEIWKSINEVGRNIQKKKNETSACYQSRILKEQGKLIDERAKKEFEEVSKILGVSPTTHDERKKIINNLTNAKAKIGEGLDDWEPLKLWGAISLDIIEQAGESIENETKIVALDINNRYQFWIKNKNESGRLKVKLEAAKYCKNTDSYENCPVCNKELQEDIKKELRELADENNSLSDSLQHYVRDIITNLEKSVPDEINKLEIDVKEQIRKMLVEKVWIRIEKLGTFKDRFAKRFKEIINELPEPEAVDKKRNFGKDEWDEEFLNGLEVLETFQHKVLLRLSFANWLIKCAPDIKQNLERIIFPPTEESGTTGEGEGDKLVTILTNLAEYTEQFSTLYPLRKLLLEASGQYEKADLLEKEAIKADKVNKKLNNLKDLDKFANILLDKDLEKVSEDMISIYDNLYPNDPVGFETIAQQKARAGTKPDYRFRLKWSEYLLADAEPVANLGRMRALLWSFAFALFKRQNSTLNTILIDDPCISLDDYHAKYMIQDVIHGQLASVCQSIVTVLNEAHLHENFVRDPYCKSVGLARVLVRDEKHRKCRIEQSAEPLVIAIKKFHEDRENYEKVIEQARITLEEHLKVLCEYLLTTDASKNSMGGLIEKLKQALLNSKNVTSISKHVDIGKIITVYEEQTIKRVLDEAHHGGQGKAALTPHDADDIVKMYKRWLKNIRSRYDEIQFAIYKSKPKIAVDADSFTEPQPISSILNKFEPKNTIEEIGQVAAEGEVTIFSEGANDINSYKWPSLHYGIVITNGCRPVVWEGQVALFSPSLPVKDGDLALIQTLKGNYLRRMSEISIDNNSESGWCGYPISPDKHNIKPVFFRKDGASVCKLVGVLYPQDHERISLAQLPGEGNEVVNLSGKGIDVFKMIKNDNARLIRVHGNSANPVALDGQCLLIETNQNDLKSYNMKPCCVTLDDNRTLFKRFILSGESNNRVVLQSLNTIEPHPVIEARLENGEDHNMKSDYDTLPLIKQVFIVRGVLFFNFDV